MRSIEDLRKLFAPVRGLKTEAGARRRLAGTEKLRGVRTLVIDVGGRFLPVAIFSAESPDQWAIGSLCHAGVCVTTEVAG